MRLRRLVAVAHKEFLHILRDSRSLGMALALPVLMLILFGYALKCIDEHQSYVAVFDTP